MYQYLYNVDNVTITNKCIRRLFDGAIIPLNDPDNKDYQEYILWLEAGNTPLDPS